MENVSEDLLVDILHRLTDEKEVVRCMCVSRSWRRMISDVLRLRYWEQSPVAGLYFRTMENPKHIRRKSPASEKQEYIRDLISHSELHDINYVSVPLQAHHERHPNADAYFIDCCNGLLLLFDSNYDIYYVWNPFTRQRGDIPKPPNSQSPSNIYCAALAFDPAESSFYRVILIGCTTNYSESESDHDDFYLIDIFSSETWEWNRSRLKLDPFFIRDSKSKFTVPRVYLRGVLYRMASSRKVSRIEINSTLPNHRSPIELPPIPQVEKRVVKIAGLETFVSTEIASIDESGAVGCLGVSMSCLSYCKREWTIFSVWLYHEGHCEEDMGEWILRYTVSYYHLVSESYYMGSYTYSSTLWMEPFALSPNSDVMFFGTSERILSYNFKSDELQFVYHKDLFGKKCYSSPTVIPGCFFPVLTFRICLVPFQVLDKRSVRCTPMHVAYTRW
ncbi:F-box domain containing protein [Trema orientale]|uniref:F-box domain containing protein n=1 Tax=Trema orientale TaxID=63057 RepID=A0A2P5AT74_TREOI|nr:F-box domain containing protein [Trema orientale]